MKIVNLESQNVKRLKAVSIIPQGNSVIIGGDNAQGKSSVLDSIFMALGGKAAQGQRPVRDGEEKAIIKCDLGELTVIRTISPNGKTTVKVTNAEGATFSSPQSMLDALSSKLTFDPLAFAGEKPAAQLETLKGLVGLDFSDLEAKRKSLYDKRTDINRAGKDKAARLDGMQQHSDAPAEAVSVSDLMAMLTAADAKNAENEKERQSVRSRAEKIATVKAELEAKQKELAAIEAEHAGTEDAAALLVDTDTIAIREQIAQADTINAKVRENAFYAEEKAAAESLRAESQGLTNAINAIDKQKADAMAAAEFPVDGLSFDENGVIYNGIPFSQCSSAERLLVSLHMGIAMNPELKVLLIRDGSLLDPQSLAMVAKAAEDADAQVWIERVSKGDECSVIIEDGEIIN